MSKLDAARAIEAVDATSFEQKIIRATFGTTKYCSYFLKGLACQNIGCQFLHENGEDAEAYLKEESRLYNQRSEKATKIAFQNYKKEEEYGLPSTSQWAKPVINDEQFPSLVEVVEEETFVSVGSACLAGEALPDLSVGWTLEKADYSLFLRYLLIKPGIMDFLIRSVVTD
jgi:hypothetical protein